MVQEASEKKWPKQSISTLIVKPEASRHAASFLSWNFGLLFTNEVISWAGSVAEGHEARKKIRKFSDNFAKLGKKSGRSNVQSDHRFVHNVQIPREEIFFVSFHSNFLELHAFF